MMLLVDLWAVATLVLATLLAAVVVGQASARWLRALLSTAASRPVLEQPAPRLTQLAAS